MQIVLPNRKRKGYILSGLFIFFVGIIGILNSFEYGFSPMAKIFKQKPIKPTVIFVSVFLFLLSTFEWSARQGFFRPNSGKMEVTGFVALKLVVTINGTEDLFYSEKTSVPLNFSIHTSCPHYFL